jgi:cytidine deaminase
MQNKNIFIQYKIYESVEELNDKDKELIEKALQASNTSYSPYSKFKVGCAIRMKNQDIIIGSNQENIAYPSGMCAERVALYKSGVEGKGQIETIAICAKDDKGKLQTAFPCGACRQVMMEYEKQMSKQPINILVLRQDKTIISFDGVDSFLPFSFEF